MKINPHDRAEQERVWPPSPDGFNARAELLREAEHLVNRERNSTYDDPIVDFARIAAYWSAYLGEGIRRHDVAAMMALLKLARIQGNENHRDSWVDLAGYAACGWDCVNDQLTNAQHWEVP